jgi:hypothetical protein
VLRGPKHSEIEVVVPKEDANPILGTLYEARQNVLCAEHVYVQPCISD